MKLLKSLLLCSIGMICGLTSLTTMADNSDVIDLTPIVEPAPSPIPVPEQPIEIHQYLHDRNDVERLARLLWSSPLRTAEEKEKLLWCVFNRLYTKRAGYQFGSSIREIVCQSEFSFFDSHAHRSEDNIQFVEETWDKYQSMRDGYFVGKHPSNLGIFIRFTGPDNRQITLLDGKNGEVVS